MQASTMIDRVQHWLSTGAPEARRKELLTGLKEAGDREPLLARLLDLMAARPDQAALVDLITRLGPRAVLLPLLEARPELANAFAAKPQGTPGLEHLELATVEAIAADPKRSRDEVKQARREIFRRTGQSFQVATPDPVIAAPRDWPVYASLANNLDGVGQQGFILARSRPEGDLAVVLVSLVPPHRSLEGFGERRLSRAAFRRMIDHPEPDTAMYPYPVGRLVARIQAAQAAGFQIHADVRPHLDLLEGLEPDTSSPVATWVAPEVLERTATLLDRPAFGQWDLIGSDPNSEALKAFVMDEEALTTHAATHAEQICGPELRAQLADVLEAQALWLDARGDVEARVLAATAAWGLRQGGDPLEQPFLRRLLQLTWERAQQSPWQAWAVDETFVSTPCSWHAAGRCLLWVRRTGPEGEPVAALVEVDLARGGVYAAELAQDPDAIAALAHRIHERHVTPVMVPVDPDQCSRVLDQLLELLPDEIPRSVDLAALALFPEPQGDEEELWVEPAPQLLEAIADGLLPSQLPTTLTFELTEPNRFRQAVRGWQEVSPAGPDTWHWRAESPSPVLQLRGQELCLWAPSALRGAEIWEELDQALPDGLGFPEARYGEVGLPG